MKFSGRAYTSCGNKGPVLVAILGLLSVGAVLISTACRTDRIQARDFNIILVSIDAARADRFSFNGSHLDLTPQLEELAQQGAVFRNTYSFGSNTTSSMGTIFTSRIPSWPLEAPQGEDRWEPKDYFGYQRFQDPTHPQLGIPDNLDTLATILKEAGYTTVGLSTNPYLTREFNFQRGFDLFEDTWEQRSYQLFPPVEAVISKLNLMLPKLQGEKFFAWLHLMDVHYPLRDYQPFLKEAMVRGTTQPLEPAPPEAWTYPVIYFLKQFASENAISYPPSAEGLKKVLREYVHAYEAEIFRIDQQIALMVEALRTQGLWENTLLVFVTDHGDEFVEHGFWGHRGQMYEGIVRGVWMMHNPILFPKAHIIESRVSLLDLLPTLLDVLDIPYDESSLDGTSRFALLSGAQDGGDGSVFGLLDLRAYLLDKDLKLMVNKDFGRAGKAAQLDPPPAPVELFDLVKDPLEKHNLASQQPDTVKKMIFKLERAFREKGAPLWEADNVSTPEPSQGISEDTKKRLRALGYTE